MELHKKTIVIGDIHGSQCWEEIVAKHPDAQYVFLGDYCDPYLDSLTPEKTIKNLQDIILFKQHHSDDVVLLLGNHDIHYIYPDVPICSRLMVNNYIELNTLFKENIELFCKAFQMRRLLFTHAGVSEEWFNHARLPKYSDIATLLNNHEEHKEVFDCGAGRGGHSPYSGIFWADSSEMRNPLQGFVQIVGHTRMEQIEILQKSDDTAVIFNDSLWNEHYVIIERTQESTRIYATSILSDKLSEPIFEFSNKP